MTNKGINLKKCLDRVKKNWVFELSSILWVFKTTPRTPTGDTLFALAFETEAVVFVKLQIPTHRVQFNDEEFNGENNNLSTKSG